MPLSWRGEPFSLLPFQGFHPSLAGASCVVSGERRCPGRTVRLSEQNNFAQSDSRTEHESTIDHAMGPNVRGHLPPLSSPSADVPRLVLFSRGSGTNATRQCLADNPATTQTGNPNHIGAGKLRVWKALHKTKKHQPDHMSARTTIGCPRRAMPQWWWPNQDTHSTSCNSHPLRGLVL